MKLEFDASALVVARIAVSSVFIVAGTVSTPTLEAQSPQPAPGSTNTTQQGAAQPAVPPKFEVAAIRSCNGAIPLAARIPGTSPLAGSSVGRLKLNCMTVATMIHDAYLMYATGHRNPGQSAKIEGGPAWINSDRYEIEAEADGAPSREMMQGPLMQALLEDRFKLKLHRETRGEIPIYVLTVAKAGFKLRPLEEGACIPFDPNQPTPPPAPGQKAPCNSLRMEPKVGATGPSFTLIADSMSIDTFSAWLAPVASLDRPIINKTGISGMFNFRLSVAADENAHLPLPAGAVPNDPAPGAVRDATGPSIFTALEDQLGLKLERAKGPQEFLVIDHVEKPSEN